MDILKAKVYDIHEEDYNIHRLRFHSAKKIMMEIGFVHLRKKCLRSSILFWWAPFRNPKRSLVAGSLEAAYSLNWGAQEIWGKGGGETLALL